MSLEQLSDALNHPATKIALGMLMLVVPYVNHNINTAEVNGIPCRYMVFALAALHMVDGLIRCAARLRTVDPVARVEPVAPIAVAEHAMFFTQPVRAVEASTASRYSPLPNRTS